MRMIRPSGVVVSSLAEVLAPALLTQPFGEVQHFCLQLTFCLVFTSPPHKPRIATLQTLHHVEANRPQLGLYAKQLLLKALLRSGNVYSRGRPQSCQVLTNKMSDFHSNSNHTPSLCASTNPTIWSTMFADVPA